uniref:Mating type gene n=1 Tax=Diaporthe sp. P-Pt-16 TaxID=309387 RepID=Q1MX51_9PEZI|nr:mating type gene [Diaporthe sp. P-Pt-16]
MDIENHNKVYLPNNVVVEASREAGKKYRDDISIRMAGNKYFAKVLQQGGIQKDQRILRVARLLDQLNGQEQKLIDLTDELFEICDREKLRYVGYHPRLERLMKDVRYAADFVDEYAKRVGLWLDYHRTHGIGLGDTARSSLQNSISKQREFTTGLVWSAAMTNPAGKIRPPGPGKLPYGPRGAPNPELQEPRKYKNGKPVPIAEKNPQTGDLQPLNWRYDPDIRYPTPYNKFLRFDGPYFSPNQPQDPAELNEFFLPASLVKILQYYMGKYVRVENNLISTGRIPNRFWEDDAEFQREQKLLGDSLALSSGENYDRFSIVSKVPHDEPVENATRPYVWVKPGTTERQVNSGDGTGKFKPEDFNRAMKQHETNMRYHVPTVDHGMRILMNRNIENEEVP